MFCLKITMLKLKAPIGIALTSAYHCNNRSAPPTKGGAAKKGDTRVIFDQAAKLEQAATIDLLWAGLLESLPMIGMDFAIYISVTSNFTDPFLRSNISGLYSECPSREDPFLNHGCKSYEIIPVGQEFSHRYSHISEDERAFIQRANARGFRAGIAIPTRLKSNDRFGGFILGNGMGMTEFTKKILPRAEEIRLFCMIVHRRIEELIEMPLIPVKAANRAALVGQDLPPAFDALTPRESEVISMLAQGKTRAETAQICNISVHTVSDHAKQGYRKLGIHNRAEAAAIMLQRIDKV